MKVWTVEKDELLEAVDVLELISPRPGVPSSEFLRVEKKKNGIKFSVAAEVSADVTLQGQGHWPFEDTLYLDRRALMPFVMAAKNLKTDAPFQFSGEGKRIVVRQARRFAKFDGNDQIKGYGISVKSELITKIEMSDRLRSLVYCARECATKDATTPQLNCVYLQPNGSSMGIFATNQKIFYRSEAKSKVSAKVPIPFPLFLVNLLGSDKLKEIHWKEKTVSLNFRQGKIWQTVSSKARKKFPVETITAYMDKGRKLKPLLTVSSKKFATLLTRLSSYLTFVRRQDWSLEISGTKGSNKLRFRSSIFHSEFKETLKLAQPLSEDIQLSWPLDMLEPIFEFLQKDKDATLTVKLYKKGHSYVKVGDVELVVSRRSQKKS